MIRCDVCGDEVRGKERTLLDAGESPRVEHRSVRPGKNSNRRDAHVYQAERKRVGGAVNRKKEKEMDAVMQP